MLAFGIAFQLNPPQNGCFLALFALLLLFSAKFAIQILTIFSFTCVISYATIYHRDLCEAPSVSVRAGCLRDLWGGSVKL